MVKFFDSVRASLLWRLVAYRRENELLREAVAQLTLENQRLVVDCMGEGFGESCSLPDWEDRLSA